MSDKMTEQEAIVHHGLDKRISEGDLEITFGEKTWPDGWYSNPWVNASIPVVADIANAVPEIKKFHVSYDRNNDYHHIHFTVDGEEYYVEWYKVFNLKRTKDKKEIRFNFDKYQIAGYFRSKKHLIETNWH